MMAPVKSGGYIYYCRLYFEKSSIVDVVRFTLVGPLHIKSFKPSFTACLLIINKLNRLDNSSYVVS